LEKENLGLIAELEREKQDQAAADEECQRLLDALDQVLPQLHLVWDANLHSRP
jgi:hypothetical protein